MRLFIPKPEDLPLQHKDYPWYLGSPDGLIYSGEIGSAPPIGGVDFKTTGRRHDYGEPGTDEVPEWVHTQADWYMGLTGTEWWDIAVLFFSPRREFAIYHIKRDQQLIDNLIEAGKDFWENHVVPQIPPPLDATPASKRLLEYLYPADKTDLLETNYSIDDIAMQIRNLERERDLIVYNLTLQQNIIKDIIGEAAGVHTSLGKVTWKKSKDREVVDWKIAADILLSHIAGAFGIDRADVINREVIKLATRITPGSRVFRTWWKENK